MVLFDSEIHVEAPLLETQLLKAMATKEFMLPGKAQVWAHPIGLPPPAPTTGAQPTAGMPGPFPVPPRP